MPVDITVSKEVDQEYLALVQEILNDREFKKLGLYLQHLKTTRLMHSLNVSYISWLLAKKWKMDERAAARAGLLHDFCPYDFREFTLTGEHQVFYHPKVAAKNSMERFELSEKEFNAILSHMFPLGPLPSSREAWLITMVDKFCAAMELCRFRHALTRKNRIAFHFA